MNACTCKMMRCQFWAKCATQRVLGGTDVVTLAPHHPRKREGKTLRDREKRNG